MYSIQWDVVRLRRSGLRLRRGELEAPVRGLLEIQEREGSTFGRVVRVAELLNPSTRWQSRQCLILPLFEPVLLRMDEQGGMSLAGVELCAGGGRVSEHQQVWRCVPVHVKSLTGPSGAQSRTHQNLHGDPEGPGHP